MQDLAAAFAEGVLGAEERLTFVARCRPAKADELAAQIDRVDTHLHLMRGAAESDPTVDVAGAEWIAAALTEMLSTAPDLSFEERRLLMGAVEYFVLSRDRAHDHDGPAGLEDDNRVVRAVCRALGREDLG